jgi:hypothetical protein
MVRLLRRAHVGRRVDGGAHGGRVVEVRHEERLVGGWMEGA